MCSGELGPGQRERGVERDGLLIVRDRASQTGRIEDHEPFGRLAFEERVVRGEVLRGPLRKRLLLPRAQRHVQRGGHLAGDVGLDLEHVGDGRIERLLPLRAGRVPRCHVHQLGAHPDPAGAVRQLLPLYRGRQQVVRS